MDNLFYDYAKAQQTQCIYEDTKLHIWNREKW